MELPRLEVQDAQGAWGTAIEDVGIPVGRPQTLVVDLRGRWQGPSRQVRLVTNMRIYWDQARVARAADAAALRPHALALQRADLRERGFSAAATPDGREPLAFDYARVSLESPWKVFPGRYTGLGDVRPLLDERDDVFVLSKPGDELALTFAALPPPPAGRRRTFLFYADGYSKEMDVNSATPDEMFPLPYHGMPRYPYGPDEGRPPLPPEKQELFERSLSRVVRRPVPPVELVQGPQAPVSLPALEGGSR
jgi:hypothetical protein